MSPIAAPIDIEAYSIVWLAPLPIETAAALLMLDEHHEGLTIRQHGQTVEYHFGQIGNHNVAIAGFPSGEVGIGKAGAMAEAVRRDFRNLDLALLVGIGAAIPSPDRDIRLGDVAVADPVGNYPGVIAYNMTKIVPGEELPKQWMDATHPLWRSIISNIKARTTVHGDTFHQHLTAFNRPEAKAFQQPHDPPPLHPRFNHISSRDGPVVHYGTILSGDKVVRAADFRDHLQTKYGDPIALEMEAAGVMTSLPVAVVRGISDSADPRKNDAWHGRAAAVAAAYAKEMLLRLSPMLPRIQQTGLVPRIHADSVDGERLLLKGRLPKTWDFRGREDHLKTIAKHMDQSQAQAFDKTVLILSGISGVGKSQLAAAYVKQQLSKKPRREIFWLRGRDKKSFENSIIEIYLDPAQPQVSNVTQLTEDTDRQSKELVNSFLQDLNRRGHTGWLMVLDDVTLWAEDEASTNDDDINLNCYLNTIQRGSLLVTTNRQNWPSSHENVLQVQGLDDTASVSLLKSKLHGYFTRDADLWELTQMLHGLPLSLRLAVTHIRKRGIKVADYIKMWRERELDEAWPLIEPGLVQTLALCIEELQADHEDAANLLTLLGFLDHQSFSFDLCWNGRNGDSPDFPEWLSAIGNNKAKFNRAIEVLLNLSFVQLNNDESDLTTYSIHPAVHAFARHCAGSHKDNYISWAVSLVADSVPRSSDKHYWKKVLALAPHADKCMLYIRTRRFPPQTLERMGALFRLLGRYEDASELYKAALRALLPHKEEYLETTAQVLNDLGLVYYGQSNFGLAVKTFQESIDTYSKLPTPLPNDSMDTFMCIIFNHGNACRMTQDLDMATAAFDRVHKYCSQKNVSCEQESTPSWTQIFFSRVLNALAELEIERKEIQQAMSKLRQAASIQIKYLDSNDPVQLSTRLNLGRAFTDLECYAEARQNLRDVAQRYRQRWGANHQTTMKATYELARASMGFGKEAKESGESDQEANESFDEAERLWMENLSFYTEKHGSDSEDALRTKANIALLQSARGDLVMARRNMLQVFQRSTIPASKVKAQCDLALICQQMNNLDVAEINFEQAVEAAKLLSEPGETRELFRPMYHWAQLQLAVGDSEKYEQTLVEIHALQPSERNEWWERAGSELAHLTKSPRPAMTNTSEMSQVQASSESIHRKRKRKPDQ